MPLQTSSERGFSFSVLTHLLFVSVLSFTLPSSPVITMAGSADKVDYSLLKDDKMDDAPTSGTDLLLGSLDPSKLHPLAGIEDKLDYLLLDDDKTTDLPGAGTAIPSRGWSDDLCYGTGTMYLSGSYSISAFHNPTPFHRRSASKSRRARSC